jgi:hypothetical protein
LPVTHKAFQQIHSLIDPKHQNKDQGKQPKQKYELLEQVFVESTQKYPQGTSFRGVYPLDCASETHNARECAPHKRSPAHKAARVPLAIRVKDRYLLKNQCV